MSTELSNGVIIPEEYSDDWYDEMSINLRKLNDVITAASDNATDIQRLDTDKANQSDLTALTSRVSQNETDIIALQTAVSGALKREIVQTLPTEDISTTTIYMIRNSESSGTNIYDEYMYINSQWELIGTSATDFSNYYTKNETDNLLSAKANQTDLTSLSGRVTQNETDITALQTAVSGALKREIVQTLPTQDISTTTIYMIRNTTTSGDNIYDEYMYINNLWELIGTSATDFSNYYTKTEIDTLLSYKATDSDVVHKSGNETVGGEKTFGDVSTFDGSYIGNEASSNARTVQILESNRDTHGQSGLCITKFRQNKAQGALSSNDVVYLTLDLLENSVRTNAIFRFNFKNFVDNVPQDIAFYPTGLKNSLGGLAGGSSNNKWHLINGINPGALSVPDFSNAIDISSYITVTGGSTTSNSYTPPNDGYISINLGRSSGAIGLVLSNGKIEACVRENTFPDNHRECGGFIPVQKNDTVVITSCLADSIIWAYFIPCQGNV